jgi:hypothetical protein
VSAYLRSPGLRKAVLAVLDFAPIVLIALALTAVAVVTLRGW